MSVSSFLRIVPVLGVLALSACASQPDNINNVCSVFNQRDGWFNNWQSEASRAERKYGVPVPVLMATLRKESGFKHNARPPRKKLLGFIPWKRPSSAYGYSQAIDGTWLQYKQESGNFAARRSDFGDAVDFVGWYHSKTADKYGVARNDTYNLYLAYYFGWSGYGRGTWKSNPTIQRYARDTEKMAHSYAAQMQRCGR
ncbi:transglycosylase SLT domain-containing protein [Mesorhizobium xinjiangense]|uniref:transglycosylase SLT domain-containing protein n=1 Tax=Mesorhizobium xinjiangense TaxID=2678685 RepID=UPI0012EE5173|nr:hypothetical protein [Mesorhizobium xinjiangense]